MLLRSKTAIETPTFKPGEAVEVSSNDEGFRGSWYTGKVIKHSSLKNPNKYLVEYDSLFKDTKGKTRLRELVDVFQIRPTAPREKARKFKFSEEVDAFHNDGWWEGVITEECSGGNRFAVFFRSTKEQTVFDEADLRLHREWVNGAWSPPLEGEQDDGGGGDGEKPVNMTGVEPTEKGVKPTKEKAESFVKGMKVEVSSDEEGFEGAWFVATIIDTIGKGRNLVEYESLRTDDDSGLLREEVDALHVRPCPPEVLVVDRFKLMDEVDALYNDGWWVGVISEVHVNSKYQVYFKDTEEKLVFKHCDLRLHQDWIDGKWVGQGCKFALD